MNKMVESMGEIEPQSHEDTKVLEPVLRFAEFAGTYRQHLFDGLFEFSTGKNIKQNEASPEFEIPCVRYGELYHMYGEVISKIVNFTNLNSSELKFSKGDEILLPSAGEDSFDIGSASALALKNIAIGRTINILSPQKEGVYSPFYMSYYINQKQRKKISRLAKGVSISNVYNSDLKKLLAVIPDLQEQQKIADFLSSVDKKIEQLTEKHRLLTQYKKGVMQQIFTQQIRFKDNQGNDYPEWEEKRLGDLSFITTGSSNREDSGLDGEFTFFDRSEDIRTSNRFLFDGEAVIVAGEGQDFIPKYFVGKFDLHQRTYAIMDFQNSIGKYLFYAIRFHKNYFLSQAVGSTVKSLRLPMFKKMPLLMPCAEEQQKIANFLTDIDKKIDPAWATLEQTKAFKKGLLQKMFV